MTIATASDLAGATDLGALAAIVARLDLLVTNDTGAALLAVATGTWGVAPMGPGQADGWKPLDRERHRVVEAHCLAGSGIEPATALRRLPVEPVLAACEAALAVMTEAPCDG